MSLSFSDRKVDLVEEGLDLVIRNGEPPDSLDLAARRLGEHGMTLCAAPSYLAERGEPMTLADLAEHEGIAYLRQGRVLAWQWQLDGQWQSVRPTGRLQLDDLHAITQAAIAGFGLAWLPSWLARPHLERGELREVLGSFKGRRYPSMPSGPQPAPAAQDQNGHRLVGEPAAGAACQRGGGGQSWSIKRACSGRPLAVCEWFKALRFNLVEPLDLVLGAGALRQLGTEGFEEGFNLLVQQPGRADDQHP